MGRLTAAASLTLVALLLMPAATVRAADPVFGTPTIESAFGEGIEVTQPVTLDSAPALVELLVTVGANPPLVTEVPSPGIGDVVLRDTFGSDGHILPNTPVVAQWRITPSAGAAAIERTRGPYRL